MNVAKTLREMVEEHPREKPIFPGVLAAMVSERTGMPVSRALVAVLSNLSGMTKKGLLARLERGVYAKTADGVFGRTTCVTRNEYWKNRLLFRKDAPAGYLTGPSALNMAGLSTWMPAKTHIATNMYRIRIPEEIPLVSHKPLANVDAENVRYVLFLHLLQSARRYHVDAEDPVRILSGLAERLDLLPFRLSALCERIGTKETLDDLANILERMRPRL